MMVAHSPALLVSEVRTGQVIPIKMVVNQMAIERTPGGEDMMQLRSYDGSTLKCPASLELQEENVTGPGYDHERSGPLTVVHVYCGQEIILPDMFVDRVDITTEGRTFWFGDDVSFTCRDDHILIEEWWSEGEP